MESDSLHPKRLISFSERVATFLTSRESLHLPSQDDIAVEDNRNAPLTFRNDIPLEEIDIRRSFIRWQHHNQSNESTLGSELLHKQDLTQTILLPATVICIPITLLAGMLLGLCYMYKINPVDSLFKLPGNNLHGSGFILVNFPATRLVFVASFLSTLAPLLGSFIMSLYCLPVSGKLLDASRDGKYLHLPTPFQMSLLIGILVASAQQLRSYIWYLLHRRRTSIPPVLHSAALMMLLGLLLAGGVFIADTVLHYTTSTIDVDQILIPPQPEQQLGRGLSEYCLQFNRTILGLPCSVDEDFTQAPDLNANSELIETSRLFQNTSDISEIQIAILDEHENAQIAYLIPKQQSLIPNTDYRASTIGVSTTCQFITSSCAMVLYDDFFTNFTCSDMFHGTLFQALTPKTSGMPPNASTSANISRPPDSGRSFLMYKPAPNLMYSFFNDSGTKNIYNTVGYNDSNGFDLNILPYSDAQLVNPFYVAFAARMSSTSGQFIPGSQMLKNDTKETFLSNKDVDFLFDCAVTSYDVTYTWVEGSLGEMEATRTGNGSVLEIFHGFQLYATISGGDPDLQSFLTYSSLAGTSTDSFLQKFGSLYSTKVLAIIGAYTSGRMSLAEQQREHMLLSKVPIPPLAFLVAFSLSYTLLGLILAFRAYWASRGNVRDIAAKLSLLGLSQAAFGDKRTGSSSGGNSSIHDSNQAHKHEIRRVVVDGSASEGFEFGVML